jgi:tRNA(fMet)-specific endonuclease VapC
LKGQFNLHQKIESVGIENCYISEITIAELKYGIENSTKAEANRITLEKFQNKFTILPVFTAFDTYAKEKARLKKVGKLLDDFDLLIGATAISNNLTLATRNVTDFERLAQIKIEDWTL